MAEYIERADILRQLRNCKKDNPTSSYAWKMALDCAISIIQEAPAADVAPVIHARWIENGNYQICSNCVEEHAWDEYRASYCEDCGAKMDLEVSDINVGDKGGDHE